MYTKIQQHTTYTINYFSNFFGFWVFIINFCARNFHKDKLKQMNFEKFYSNFIIQSESVFLKK